MAALSTMADSLPGHGIVAAMLGVVITMGALGGPPEENCGDLAEFKNELQRNSVVKRYI
jgi:flagellar motor component MotA